MFNKSFIQKRLEGYVRKYFKKHPQVKLIVVAGSVGKTTTKTAIATVLSRRFRVRMHEGNHNTLLSAPLAILGIEYPENVHSIRAWLKVFRAARKRINGDSEVDVIVQELGIDRIGEMAAFGRYLHPSIAVVTAVAPEHMEFFGTLEQVAHEELTAANFSDIAIINRDDIDGRFSQFLTNKNIDTYGTTAAAEYRFEINDFKLDSGYTGSIIAPELKEPLPAAVRSIGEHSLRPVMAAVAVALKLQMAPEEIITGLSTFHPVAGRMNPLRGLEDSWLIDDTYNASPSAVAAALQTLYTIETPQRIAILGSMNELGTTSAEEHKLVGELCDPNLLDWVITVGKEANDYLAPAAKARGCQVKSFLSALDAGAFAHSILRPHAVVLAKGSQGDIYLEEALKILLHETHEDHELVRQSPAWLQRKNDYFASLKQ